MTKNQFYVLISKHGAYYLLNMCLHASNFYGTLRNYLVETLSLQPFEPVHEISNNVVCATSKAPDQPAHMRSLIRAFACCLNILYEC